MKRVLIRVDGSTTIGMGHVIRTISLAHYLSSSFDILFIVNEQYTKAITVISDEGFLVNPIDASSENDNCSAFMEIARADDIIVIDGYHFSYKYQKKVTQRGNRVILFDDMFDKKIYCDFVINSNPLVTKNDYKKITNGTPLLGLNYLLLRPSFFYNTTERRVAGTIKKILICMGGVDYGNHSIPLSRVLHSINSSLKITIIFGNKNIADDRSLNANEGITIKNSLSAKEMAHQIENHDLCITASSSIAWECCAIGVPLIVGQTIDNQQKLYDYFTSTKLALGLGDLSLVKEYETLSPLLEHFLSDKEAQQECFTTQKTFINAESIKNTILNFFLSL